MRIFRGVLTLLLALAGAATAQAGPVVTFEADTLASDTLLGAGQFTTVGDFRFDFGGNGFAAAASSASFDPTQSSTPAAPLGNDTQYLAMFSDTYVSMTRSDGARFVFEGLDLAYIAPTQGPFVSGLLPGVLLVFYDIDGDTNAEGVIQLSLGVTNADGFFEFNRFGADSFGEISGGVSALTFAACTFISASDCNVFNGGQGQFAIDNLRTVPATGTLALLGLGMVLVGLGSAQAQAQRKAYIVQLADAPVAAYEGTVSGLAATRPAPGAKLNMGAQAVQDYQSYLQARAASSLADVPAAQILHRYQVVFNGYAALLTPTEVNKLRGQAGVLRITESTLQPLDTSYTTSRFLGLANAGGAWSRSDAAGRALKGEGVIVGVLDSGIWPENPAVLDHVDAAGKPVAAGTPGATSAYAPLPAGRFRGTCVTGEGFAAQCNNKLIGARYYNAGWLRTNSFQPYEFNSPRDSNGHGSHVASIAVGNAGSVGTVVGSPFEMSGVAPRARLAVYKVCWSVVSGGQRSGNCDTSDQVAALDQAVADGVDVINISIGGERTTFLGPVDIAAFNATRAGVFMATSAGNSGPGNQVAHVAPWTTTVGNSTHDRFTHATVTLGDGSRFDGPSYQTAGLPSKPLVLARDAGVLPFASLGSDADRLSLARCYNDADRAAAGGTAASLIDPAKVAGKVLVCFRGGNALVNKAAVARGAGAAGMVIQNMAGAGIFNSVNTTLLLPFELPTVHLSTAAQAAVLAQATAAGGTASFGPAFQVAGAIAPVMAEDSSRGPNRADPNVLKPELTAPGTDIIGSYVPEGFDTPLRNAIIAGGAAPQGATSIGGTSMASPHVAGAAALLKQLNPTWSPMAIKSALMTSAQSIVKKADGSADADRWGYGAGHLTPNDALSTTLVYDASTVDLANYGNRRINGLQLNQAAITHAEVVGVGSLQRTLTNRGTSTVTVAASAAVPGFAVQVVPAALTLAPGASGSFRVTLTRDGAPIGAYQFGQLVWEGGGQRVRSPLTARANAFVGSAELSDTRASGTRFTTVGAGYTGALATRTTGLVPAQRWSTRVAVRETVCTPIAVAAGSSTVRVQLFNDDTEGHSGTDLDLFLLDPSGATVAASAGPDSNERIVWRNPTAGTWQACVEGFAPANGVSAGFVLSSWVVDPARSPGTFSATVPASVTMGGVAPTGLSWNVVAGNRYLGEVAYAPGASEAAFGRTTLFVDTAAPAFPSTTALAPLERNKPAR
jgi:subtilisin family serine protease